MTDGIYSRHTLIKRSLIKACGMYYMMTSVKRHRANLIGVRFPFAQRLGDQQQQFRNL